MASLAAMSVIRLRKNDASSHHLEEVRELRALKIENARVKKNEDDPQVQSSIPRGFMGYGAWN